MQFPPTAPVEEIFFMVTFENYETYIPVVVPYKEDKAYIKFIIDFGDGIKPFTVLTSKLLWEKHQKVFDTIGPFEINDEDTLLQLAYERYTKLYQKLHGDYIEREIVPNTQKAICIPKKLKLIIADLSFKKIQTHIKQTMSGAKIYHALKEKILRAIAENKIIEDELNFYVYWD